MSADNGIYILKAMDQYRVAHLQGFDNIIWSHIDGVCDRLIPTRVVEMFGNCKFTRKPKMAVNIANKMLEEQFCEYGIVHIEYPGSWAEILSNAKEYAQMEIDYIKKYAPQNSYELERLQKIALMDCPKVESKKAEPKLKSIQEIIDKNPGYEFVVHCKTMEETKTLVNLLESMNYEYAIPLNSLTNMAINFAEDYGWNGCWRISASRGVAYHPDESHWVENGYSILQMENYMS